MADASGDVKKLGAALQKDLEPRQRAINSLVKDFLGTNEIRRANEYAKAVEAIGGASALTAGDQVKVNKAVTEALDHYRALGQQAPAHLLKLQEATKQVDDSLSKRLTAGAIAVGTAMGTFIGHMAYDAVKKLGAMLVEVTANGIKLAGTAAAFSSLARSIGETEDAILSTTRTATKGLITDLEIMAAANKGILLGLPITSQSMGTMAQAAVVLGKAMGQGPNKSLDDLMIALGRSSPMILDNLGLSVKVGEANDKYAASLGKTAAQLTDTEKKTAFYNAAMEAAKQKVEDLGGVQLTMADHLQRMKVSITNVTDAFGIAVAQSPVIKAAFGDVADSIEDAMGGNQAALVQSFIKVINTVAIEVIKLAEVTAVSVAAMAQGWASLKMMMSPSQMSMADWKAMFGGSETAAGINAIADRIKAMRERMEEAAKTSVSTDAITKSLNRTLRDTGAAAEVAAKGTKTQADATQKLADQMLGKDLAAKMKQLADAYLLAATTGDVTATEFDKLAKEVLALERAGAPLPALFEHIYARGTKLEFSTKVTTTALQGQRMALNGVRSATLSLLPDLDKFISKNSQVMKVFFGGALKPADVFSAPLTKMEQLSAATSTTAKAFERLATVSGGTMSDVSRGIGSALSSTSLFADSWKQVSSAKTFTGMLNGLAGVAGAIGQGIQLAIQLGKALHDAFTRSESEKAAADIRRNFGANVTEDSQVSQDAEALVKRLKIDRNLALDLLLPDILKEAGGLNKSNFGAFRDRTLELFDDIRLGGEVGEKALASLDSMMGELGQHVVAQGGIWDQHFIAMLERARAEGLELASVMDLIKGQLDIASSATAKITAGFGGTISNAFKAKTGNLPAEEGARADAVKDANAQIVANYQTEFDRIANITLASFNAQIANGKTAVEATRALGPAIADLITASKDFGFAGGAAFDQLNRWSGLVEANAPLLDQVGGLNELMTALANIGALNASTFADLQAQGVSAFEQLTAAGFSEQESLAQMAPLLESIRKAHLDKGLAIDEGTQKLIDQAEAEGILAAEGQSTNDVLKDGLGQIITLLGGDLPDAWKKTAKAAKDAAADITQNATKKISNAIDDVGDDLTREDDWATWAQNAEIAAQKARDAMAHFGTVTPGFHVSGFDPEGLDVPHMAEGGIVTRPTLAMIGERGTEAVVPLGKNFGMGGNATIILERDGRKEAEWLVPYIPGGVERLRLYHR